LFLGFKGRDKTFFSIESLKTHCKIHGKYVYNYKIAQEGSDLVVFVIYNKLQ
jgi:hypothetical protein